MPLQVIVAASASNKSLHKDIQEALRGQEEHELVDVPGQVELVRFFHNVLPTSEEAVLLILDGNLPLQGSRKAKQKEKEKTDIATGLSDEDAINFIESATSSYQSANLAVRNAALLRKILAEYKNTKAGLYLSDSQKTELSWKENFEKLVTVIGYGITVFDYEIEEQSWPLIIRSLLKQQRKF